MPPRHHFIETFLESVSTFDTIMIITQAISINDPPVTTDIFMNYPRCSDWLNIALLLTESADKYHYIRRWRQIENGKEVVLVFKRLLVGCSNTQGRVEKQLT